MPKKSNPVAFDPDDDAAIKREIRLALIDIMRNATREKRISYECDQHPKYKANGRGYKHQINIQVEDAGARISACKELLNRMEGTPGVRKERAAPKTSGRALEELTDDELQALMEVDSGETDIEPAEEAP